MQELDFHLEAILKAKELRENYKWHKYKLVTRSRWRSLSVCRSHSSLQTTTCSRVNGDSVRQRSDELAAAAAAEKGGR